MSLTKHLCSTLLTAALALSAPTEAKTPKENPVIHKTTEDFYSPLMIFPFKASSEVRIDRANLKYFCEKYFSLLKQELSVKYHLSVSSPSRDMEGAELFTGALLGGTCSWDEDYLPPKLKVEMVYYDGRRRVEDKIKASGEYRNSEKLEDLVKKMAEKIVVKVVTTKDDPLMPSSPSFWKFREFRDYYPTKKASTSSPERYLDAVSPATREINTTIEHRANPSKRKLFGNGVIIGTGGGIAVHRQVVGSSESAPFDFANFPLVLGYRWAFNSKISASLESYSNFLMDVPILEDFSINLSYYSPLKGRCSVSGDPAQCRLMFEAGGGGTFTNSYNNLDRFKLSAQPAASLAFGVDALTDKGYSFQFKFRALYSPNHLLKEDPSSNIIYPFNFSNVQFIMAYVF